MLSSNGDASVCEIDGASDASDAARTLREMCLSGEHEEAFYVLDVGDVVRKHREWRAKLPRVQPFYAVKCNDHVAVLEMLAALGTGFDCASKGEIDKILSLGVDPKRIIFAQPTKLASHIRHAAALKVDLMTFDNKSELHKIKRIHPTAKLVIRYACDSKVSHTNFGIKFGCDAVKEGPGLLKLARELGLNIVGVSFHVGSGCGEPAAFRRAISAARVLFDLGSQLGHRMHLLDLGGGFPGEKGTSIDELAGVINLALSHFFPSDDVTVIAEPGRYFVASAFTLAACVHSKREVLTEDGQDIHHVMYYVTDGVYSCFNGVIFSNDINLPKPLNQVPEGKPISSSVWGQSCDSLDIINNNILLPELEVGDWLVYEDMGAYTLALASNFNGFPIPLVHVVADKQTWLLIQDLLEASIRAPHVGNGDNGDVSVSYVSTRLESYLKIEI